MPSTSEPGLRERKKLATWRDIRQKALGLFEERGFESVSVDEIAAAAEVSRATFFNYFSTKEAVVFDPDPQDESRWRSLIAEVPAERPTWEALEALFIGFTEVVADRFPLQKQLKARSPALARSARDSSDRFIEDLQHWARSREDAATADLMVNAAMAASGTAWSAWKPGEPLDRYLRLLRQAFGSLGQGLR